MNKNYVSFWRESMTKIQRQQKLEELFTLLRPQKLKNNNILIYYFIPDPPPFNFEDIINALFAPNIFSWGTGGKGIWIYEGGKEKVLAEQIFDLRSDKLFLIAIEGGRLLDEPLEKWIEKIILKNLQLPDNSKMLVFDWGDLQIE